MREQDQQATDDGARFEHELPVGLLVVHEWMEAAPAQQNEAADPAMPRAARADGQRNQQAARRLHRDGGARQRSVPKLALPAGDPHRLLLNREGE